MTQLKYKAASVHIGYLLNPETQSKLMYFDHYAFTDDCFPKSGGMIPQKVIQDDQTFKLMIVAGTVSKMQTH